MTEVLQFVFRDFWTWLGSVILLSAFGGALGAVFRGMRGKP